MSEPGQKSADRSGLTLCRNFSRCPPRHAAYGDLLRVIFDVSPEPPGAGPAWRPLAYFDADGRCVASLELGDLSLATADGRHRAAGVRLVGVAESWRGHGLFRALIEHVLGECAARDVDLVLLFAEDMELYRRFGFEPVAQHAFAGPPPRAMASTPARELDLASQRFGSQFLADRDKSLVDRILAIRAPVSGQVALVDAPSLFLDRLGGDDDLTLAHLPDDDALVLFADDGDTLVLADLASETMPTMAHVLGALPRRYDRVVTLFPPDRLDWATALPIPEETGLMARGPLPAAMRQPFMLPPTANF